MERMIAYLYQMINNSSLLSIESVVVDQNRILIELDSGEKYQICISTTDEVI